MSLTPTQQANALGIPLTHRNADAKDVTSAAALFRDLWKYFGPDRWRTGQAGSSGKAIPNGIKTRLDSPDQRIKRGAKLDLRIYELLGMLSGDDAYTTISLRQLTVVVRDGLPVAGQAIDTTDVRGVPRNIRLSVKRLADEGTLRTHSWPWRSRKGTAYYLVTFAAMLDNRDKLRPPRPEISALLETSGHSQRKQVVTVSAPAGKQVVTLFQSCTDQIKDQQDSLRESPDRTGARPRSTPQTARSAAAKESLKTARPYLVVWSELRDATVARDIVSVRRLQRELHAGPGRAT